MRKINRRLAIPALSIFLALFFFGANTQVVLAEDMPLPPLPGPKETTQPFYISNKNAWQFQEVLLAPIAAWLKEGRFMARVVRELDFPWTMSKEWNEASQTNAGKIKLTNDRSLSAYPERGYPFDLSGADDPKTKAFKILWNSTFAAGVPAQTLYGFDMTWMGTRGAGRHTTGFLAREVNTPPFRAAEDGQTPAEIPLWREVFQMTAPPVIYGFTSITWRYPSVKEDEVWLYSPVLALSRKILGSNRSDPLLGSLLTVDDLFVWSEKIQEVDAEVVEEKELLVPFPSLSPLPIQDEQVLEASLTMKKQPEQGDAFENVPTVRPLNKQQEGQTSSVLWNYQTMNHPQLAPWIPTTVTFVPRSVWILEISPRDPYYLSGRQVLVIDKESFLPMYKVVYDRKGIYSRLVMGGWFLGSGGEGDQSARYPIFAFLVVVDRGMLNAVGFSTQYARLLGAKGSKVTANVERLFDIKSHEKKPPTSAAGLEGSSDAPSQVGSVSADPTGAEAVPVPEQEGTLPPAKEAPEEEILE